LSQFCQQTAIHKGNALREPLVRCEENERRVLCSYKFGVILRVGMLLFEWDSVKARVNLQKHSVSVEDAPWSR
jgi:hypothetical protein